MILLLEVGALRKFSTRPHVGVSQLVPAVISPVSRVESSRVSPHRRRRGPIKDSTSLIYELVINTELKAGPLDGISVEVKYKLFAVVSRANMVAQFQIAVVANN
eukprot:scaffold127092_cov41-Attheya_sp.AAC.1